MLLLLLEAQTMAKRSLVGILLDEMSCGAAAVFLLLLLNSSSSSRVSAGAESVPF
jgi:hypothetical protein